MLNREIVETPPSPLSVNAVVELGFREPVVPEYLAGTVLDNNPFEFTPAMKGKAEWISTTRLRFSPEQPMPAGLTFQARLVGRVAFGANRKVDDFTFSFKIAEQEVTGFSGDFVPDSAGKNMIRFRGVLAFAQKVDVEVIRKALTCKVKSGNVALALQPDAGKPLQVAIVSEPLKRGTSGYILAFTLPEKYTVRKGEWRTEVYLPESNLFKVLTHMDMSEPDAKQRVYGFRCTDPVKTGIDLSGFVDITPAIEYTLDVAGKYLKVKGPFVPGISYSIVIRKGFPSALNMAFAEEYRTSFTFSNLKPQVEWLSPGIILPSSNEYKLQFKSVNVAKAHLIVTEIFGNTIGFFLQNNVLHASRKGGGGYDDEESGYYYRGNNGFNDLDRVGKMIYDDSLDIASTANTWIQSELDLGSVFKKKRNSVFVVTLEFNHLSLCGTCTNDRDSVAGGNLFFDGDDYYKNPCREGYYYRNGAKHKLLVASDIAFTVKRARDGLHVYAVNAVEAKPAAGVECGLYTYQNQLIAKMTTDNSGHLLFTGKIDDASSIRGTGEHALAFFKLNEASWEINNFDVGGASEGEGGLNVFPYTERGVHRPGDTIHLSCIVRFARENPDSALPVLLTVYNARNIKAYEAKNVCGESEGEGARRSPCSLYDWPIPTAGPISESCSNAAPRRGIRCICRK